MPYFSVHDVYKDRICGLCGTCLQLEDCRTHDESSFDRYQVKHGSASRVYNCKSSVVADRIEKHYGEPYPTDPNFPPYICASCRGNLYKVAEMGKDIELYKTIPFDIEFSAKHLNVGAEKITLMTDEQLQSLSECQICLVSF